MVGEMIKAESPITEKSRVKLIQRIILDMHIEMDFIEVSFTSKFRIVKWFKPISEGSVVLKVIFQAFPLKRLLICSQPLIDC